MVYSGSYIISCKCYCNIITIILDRILFLHIREIYIHIIWSYRIKFQITYLNLFGNITCSSFFKIYIMAERCTLILCLSFNRFTKFYRVLEGRFIFCQLICSDNGISICRLNYQCCIIPIIFSVWLY